MSVNSNMPWRYVLCVAFFCPCGCYEVAAIEADTVCAPGDSACNGDRTLAGDTNPVAEVDNEEAPPPVVIEVPLVADGQGWVDADTNTVGIQGGWYTTVTGGAHLTPWGMPVSFDEQLCTNGYVYQVEQEHEEDPYEQFWGGGIAFDLCALRIDGEVTPETRYTLAECPIISDLRERFSGIGFRISGNWATDEIRVVFRERDREHSTYVAIRSQGTYAARLDDAAVVYDPQAPPPDPGNIESIYFLVPADEFRDRPFTFCLFDFSVLVAEI